MVGMQSTFFLIVFSCPISFSFIFSFPLTQLAFRLIIFYDSILSPAIGLNVFKWLSYGLQHNFCFLTVCLQMVSQHFKYSIRALKYFQFLHPILCAIIIMHFAFTHYKAYNTLFLFFCFRPLIIF